MRLTFVTIAALVAVGVCAGTAAGNLLNAALWRGLAVPHPQQLVRIALRQKDGTVVPFPESKAAALAQNLTGLSGTCAYGDDLLFAANVSGSHALVSGMAASGRCFATLGIRPYAGRLLGPSDDGAGAQAAVLGFRFWRAHFSPQAPLAAEHVTLAGHPFQVVGVLPPTFGGLDPGFAQDVVVPLAALPDVEPGLASVKFLTLMARLHAPATRAALAAQASAVWPQLTKNHAGRIEVTSAASGVGFWRASFAPTLVTACWLAGLLVLILCVSLAAIAAADHRRRRAELATRMALGASAARLARIELLRPLAPSAMGLATGLALVPAASAFLQARLWQGNAALALTLRPGAAAISLAVALTLLCAAAAGMGPALATLRMSRLPWRTLQRGAPMQPRGQVLVCVQMALIVAMLAAFGLVWTSFRKLTGAPFGFETANVVSMSLYPTPGGYRDRGLRADHQQLLQTIARLPGVAGAALSKLGPVSPGGDRNPSRVMLAGGGAIATADVHEVSSGFFAALGIPFLRGHNFGDGSVVVNETLARRLGGGALGQTVTLGSGHTRYRVVGVVRDARLYDPHIAHAPAIFVPLLAPGGDSAYATLIARTRGDWMPVAKHVETAVASTRREFAIRVKSLSDAERGANARQRAAADIGGVLALAVLLLAMISAYALTRALVHAMRRDSAVRLALGATPARVFWRTLASPLIIAGAGIAAGIPIALLSATALRPLLYQTSPADPVVLAATAALLLSVTAAAALLPALAAARQPAWPVLQDIE